LRLRAAFTVFNFTLSFSLLLTSPSPALPLCCSMESSTSRKRTNKELGVAEVKQKKVKKERLHKEVTCPKKDSKHAIHLEPGMSKLFYFFLLIFDRDCAD
jgi:hypothetical protein